MHTAIGAETAEPPTEQIIALTVKTKFVLAVLLSFSWFAFATWIALPWIRDLAHLSYWPVALLIVGGIALVPGLMNAFLAVSLLLDDRPSRRSFDRYPGISILIAAFNEEDSIEETLRSLACQDYPGEFEALVIDDSSTDRTASIVENLRYPWLRLLLQKSNLAKSAALNRGLAEATSMMPTSIPNITGNGRPDWPCESVTPVGSGPERWPPAGNHSTASSTRRSSSNYAPRDRWAGERASYCMVPTTAPPGSSPPTVTGIGSSE